ncbi:hypothetical protein GCK72_001767 [Caenorhabditis remanei]|uniref:Uncharacterized protein n=3 Tax=Caenorhabditis TaxID=6237 RepID=E3LLR9_CAERE|nr:hypothetical protein GCK72_001767 [Caenorhabditis remanei]EFP03140.1 hypothetical protein CRE_28546 [Caenorhabditis remanei]KAF1769950.1 hypothetical protein GCK72_001767 [Caenorhabditis remanei]
MTTSSPNNGVKLIIFDKDGTLLDFHKMWMPYATTTVRLLEAATNLRVGPAIYKTLGVDPVAGKVSMGALAEKTLTGIREDISLTLQTFGITPVEADAIVHGCVPEASPGEMSPVCDMPALFTTLKSMGIKIAVCTADSRAATIDQMNKMGVVPFLDDVICGNDVGIVPKPSPHCAIQICRRLGVELKETLMVGDTIADLKMGKVAGLRASVAVMTGVGTRETLAQYSDYFLEDISELPHLITKTMTEDTKRG